MPKARPKLDPRQLQMDFDAMMEEYEQSRKEIVESMQEHALKRSSVPTITCSADEVCVEIAAACKRAIRDSGMSRDQLVDAINGYFGWSENGEGERKPLSLHMLNHYLSKPSDYPIPLFILYAIQHITWSLEPAKALVEPFDARVITGEEVRQMTLGKLDDTIVEMQRLKKELRGKR